MSPDALLAAARAHVGAFALTRPDRKAAIVAAALVTEAGTVHTGVSLDLDCGIGFCAEHSAVAAMLQARETVVVRIAAVSTTRILPPCGRCRELLLQVDARNADCEIVLGPETTVRLRELHLHSWS